MRDHYGIPVAKSGGIGNAREDRPKVYLDGGGFLPSCSVDQEDLCGVGCVVESTDRGDGVEQGGSPRKQEPGRGIDRAQDVNRDLVRGGDLVLLDGGWTWRNGSRGRDLRGTMDQRERQQEGGYKEGSVGVHAGDCLFGN